MKTILLLLLGTVMTHAQFVVTVSPPKIASQKAIIPLALKNNLSENIESARAVVFLLDGEGNAVGQPDNQPRAGSSAEATRMDLRQGQPTFFTSSSPQTSRLPLQT